MTKTKKKHLAFGVEPSNRKFRLRLARYQAIVDIVREFRSRQEEEAGPPAPLRLLDVGAGQGRTLRFLQAARLDGGMEFYGVDNCAKRRERLFEPDRWDYRLLDVQEGLPFADEAFDIVICEQVLEHLTRPDAVLYEIERVLKPGGIAVLGVPSFPPILSAIRRHIIPRVDRLTGAKRDHEQVFTKSSIVRLVDQQASLRVDRVQAFRIVSGGLLSKLEDFQWWYRLSQRIATACPSLAIEIQIVAQWTPNERS